MSDAHGEPQEVEPGQVATRRVYTGRMVALDVDTVRFPNGRTGEMEIFRHPGASAVVPFLSDPSGEDPQLLLIRQYFGIPGQIRSGDIIYSIPYQITVYNVVVNQHAEM